MKRHWLTLIGIPLLLACGCSTSPQQDLPPTLMWDKDQNLISPAGGTMNIWRGFSIQNDHFAAGRDISQFILWRSREAKVAVLVEYSLQGQKIKFTVNAWQKKTLLPTMAFKWATFDFRLSRGFNFLAFPKKSKDILKIRSICIGARREKPEPHLLAGQSFSLFHLPGKGRLELRGRGAIEIVQEQTAGETLTAKSVELRSGFFSAKIARDLEFSGPGLLIVRAKKGSFNISAYSYAATAAREANPKITLKKKPNIYIVLSDACQASHLGTYGYRRNTSPQIDAFARDAVVYENAYTNAVFTLASVSTIFSGLYPDRHNVKSMLTSLPLKLLTLPEYLKSKEYSTCIITSSFGISPNFGFTQGVDDYLRVAEKYWAPKGVSIFSQFSGWLEKAPPVHFSYMHFIHPHFPKVPPAGFPVSFRPGKEKTTLERIAQLVHKKKTTGIPPDTGELQEITDAYDSSIAWVDSEFGKILLLLKQKKLYDDSVIIFLADHGEALGEHGVLSHSDNVYDETSRVPLIIKYPKSLDIKGRVGQLAELADIFPTIASLFGQPLTLDGRNLLASGSNGALNDSLIVSRTINKCPQYGLRWKNWYYMIDLGDNNEKLFSLTNDPFREVNASHPAITAFLKARFLSWYSRFRIDSNNAAEISLKSLPASEVEEMKTLGYL
jgi:arylsulfatase A-like enzyme